MTKKHFEAIAAILARSASVEGWHPSVKGEPRVTVHIASHLADYFATINPNFNYAQFMRAAGQPED